MGAEKILGLQKRRTSIDAFVIDVTEFIDTTLSATVTRWPIEPDRENPGQLGLITDNITLEPLSFSLTGFISNAPLDDNLLSVRSIAQGVLAGLGGEIAQNTRIGGASLIGTGLGAGIGALAGGALAQFKRGGNGDEAYAKVAMQTLISMYKSKKPFTIQTFFFPEVGSSNIYSNMVITNLNFPQNVQTGDGLPFTMQCEQVQIVNLEITDVDGSFIKGFQAANSAPKKKDLGKQGTKTPAPQAQVRTSFWIDLWNFATGG